MIGNECNLEFLEAPSSMGSILKNNVLLQKLNSRTLFIFNWKDYKSNFVQSGEASI